MLRYTLFIILPSLVFKVNNWFANARRRLKNTVRHPDMAWDERIRLYNSHVSANAELLSCHSGGRGDDEDREGHDAADSSAREEERRRRCEAAAHAVAEAAAGCLIDGTETADNLHHAHHHRVSEK